MLFTVTAVRRRKQTEVARWRYLVSFAKGIERQWQQELLAVRPARALCTQQTRDCLTTAECQIAANKFLRRSKGTQLVCYVSPSPQYLSEPFARRSSVATHHYY